MSANKERIMMGGLRRLLNGTARMTRRGAGRIGYYLLTNPRRIPDDPGTDEFIKDAEAETIHLLGNDIRAYHWPGTGPSVLLLHGWESSTARWHALFPLLRDNNFDVYAIDAPAHGRSGGKQFTILLYTQILQAYSEHLGFAPDIWIGHSGGGMASIYYNSQPEYTFRPKEMVCMAVPGELENFIDKFCDFVGANARVKYGIEQRFVKNLQARFSDVNFKEFVKKVKIPGLIIHDEEDDVAPIEGARTMHENWLGSRLVTTQGCGHSLTGGLVPVLVLGYLQRERQ
ncbi:alpha/beta fold hydrolase [Neolewinella antarctica]|uniref:Pimeloyl-ACP methyl ester carboxylesterase n=1 Tax=Neolewinella antarctica TaxID=442734 RepID=A0ABX0XDX3_9BACT|nr:alpha/beta hydrolase [Neolewinella antarctica]NJC27126.1 pimeloyl-ACP methyl ester carboxylesterase [Neolewinella antarctica]